MNEIVIEIPVTPEGYATFMQCKRLPRYRVSGNRIITDEASYSLVFDAKKQNHVQSDAPFLFDFQKEVCNTALRMKRYAAFLDCGLGKTPIELAWAQAVSQFGRVLIMCPLSVYRQMISESVKFLGQPIASLRDGEPWERIGLMNYESMRDLDMSGCAGVVLDEGSILKNDNGAIRNYLCALVKNVDYRLSASATPAPNEHDEYANQAVFLGLYKNVNEFFAQFFRKDGTNWILRGHAREAFYSNLSSWGTYIRKPSLMGYSHTTELPEEPEYIWQYCDLPAGFKSRSGKMFASADSFKDMSLIYGSIRSDPESPRMKAIVRYAKNKRCIVWANRNEEEAAIAKALGDCVIVNGAMEIEDRVKAVEAYRAGMVQHLISKPKVLGFGVNIPECNHMIFSGFTFSMEQFYQAVRRAHRYGRTGRLQVFVPYTDPESGVLNDLQAKLARFDQDANELQERYALNYLLKKKA